MELLDDAREEAKVDVLIPTYARPASLAITLTSLCAQDFKDFRVIVSDQTEEFDLLATDDVKTPLRVLRAHGHRVTLHRHLPRRGMAEHRQFLLDQVDAPYALYIDDDVIVEPWLIGTMLRTLEREACGFVGSAVHGLSYLDDFRPHEEIVEFWETKVKPEEIRPGTPEWQRHRLHSAANLFHVQQRLKLTPACPRTYRVAWVGACVLYDTAKLRNVGGFQFWRDLPLAHCGEDVLAQQRLMARYGGCGLLPSGAYHQELPTTIVDRSCDAPWALPLEPAALVGAP